MDVIMGIGKKMVMLSKSVLLCSVCHADLDVTAEVSKQVYDHQIIEKRAISRIVLASQSEHRKKAMNILGLSYECIPANINEKAIRNPDPLKMALMISEAKALSLVKEKGIIIAGDTFLVFEGKVLEKPTSLNEAYAMLNILSGNKYTLISGLAVYDTLTGKMRSTVATCDIYLRTISQEEITDYCNRYPVLKFAGAHETDGVVRFSERIERSCIIETTIPMKDLILFLQEIEEERLQGQDDSIWS
jgi:predicted house-cleaning NTP pyrophosphatase (Maf/HAM1 superfamily)